MRMKEKREALKLQASTDLQMQRQWHQELEGSCAQVDKLVSMVACKLFQMLMRYVLQLLCTTHPTPTPLALMDISRGFPTPGRTHPGPWPFLVWVVPDL